MKAWLKKSWFSMILCLLACGSAVFVADLGFAKTLAYAVCWWLPDVWFSGKTLAQVRLRATSVNVALYVLFGRDLIPQWMPALFLLVMGVHYGWSCARMEVEMGRWRFPAFSVAMVIAPPLVGEGLLWVWRLWA
jgi:hypothetical protein